MKYRDEIEREDSRYINFRGFSHSFAKSQGALWRAALAPKDMGFWKDVGCWTGEDVEDFRVFLEKQIFEGAFGDINYNKEESLKIFWLDDLIQDGE